MALKSKVTISDCRNLLLTEGFDHAAYRDHTKQWQAKAAAESKVAAALRDLCHQHLDGLTPADVPREFDVRIVLYPHEDGEIENRG